MNGAAKRDPAVVEIPKISFLMAVHDHPSDLDRCLDALIGQKLLPADYEIIVIDTSRVYDCAPAYERALTRKDARLRLHYEPIDKGGRAKAYNHGLQLCQAPIILFFADDFLAAPRTAEVHLRFRE